MELVRGLHQLFEGNVGHSIWLPPVRMLIPRLWLRFGLTETASNAYRSSLPNRTRPPAVPGISCSNGNPGGPVLCCHGRTLGRLYSIRKLLTLLGLLVAPVAARHLPIQVYTSAQGLPHNAVSCLLPSGAGFLWLCTPEGLVRFDGYHFRVFGPDEGLPSRKVIGMTAAPGGGFWILTDRGLCRLGPASKVGGAVPLAPHR